MPAKYTINHMQQFAREKNGKCLSKEYINDDGKLTWMCSKGHAFDYSYTIIRQGGWCMQCTKNANSEEKLEELKQIAKKKGGKCLSNNYSNILTKLSWECKEGHRWEAAPNSIKNADSWCPYCSHHVPYTIKDMKAKAKERGGKCLSTKYTNSQTKLLWQCVRGHKWEAKPNSVFIGRWCR